MIATPDLASAFLSNSPEMLFTAPLAGDSLFLSRGFQDALKIAPETSAIELKTLLHQESVEAWKSAWARVSGGAGTAAFYAKLRLADGSYQAFAVTLWTSPGAPVVYGSVKPASDPSTELKVDIFRTIIENIPIVVWATNEEGIFTYHDGKGLEAANLAPGTFVGHNVFQLFTDPVTTGNMKTAYGGESTHVVADIQDIVWESWCLPIRGAGGKVRGVVGASLNITEAKRIEQELRAKLDLIEKQQRVIRSLATPIIQVWDEVLTMPMVGMVDSMRASEVMDTLLQEVSKTRARFAIIDITGVEVMDTATVSHILRLMHAIQLLGAEGIITGIHPAIAQIIVGLGVDLAGIKTLGSLRDGLRYCMARMQSNGPARERSDARPRSVR